ncbi:uncharacterized protein BXZ73DRAFT_15975, partial [Epithele typhae]|uniref:uncharacterized protein n=1 Tax=Epithele typhae TaxID=378194 RepID=UPI00200876FF
ELDKVHHLCLGHTLHLSETKADEGEVTGSKIDGGFFHDDDKDFLLPGVPNWHYSRFLVEFKNGDKALDPFIKDSRNKEDSQKRSDVRGQLYTYADCLLYAQHRTHLFMLFVNGSKYRLLHWDKSGLIVSHAKSYLTTKGDTKEFLSLLADLSALSSKDAGLDPSAERLSPKSCGWARMDWVAGTGDSKDLLTDIDENDTAVYNTSDIRSDFLDRWGDCTGFAKGGKFEDPHAKMDEKAEKVWSAPRRTFKYIRELFAKSLAKNASRYVLKIEGKRYLVGNALVRTHEPFGRGTRGWPAIEWHTQSLVFVKDAWQPHYVGVDPEHVTLRNLNEAQVAGVPTLIAAQAYEGHVTFLSSIAGVTNPAPPPDSSNPLATHTPTPRSRATDSRIGSALVSDPPHQFTPPSSSQVSVDIASRLASSGAASLTAATSPEDLSGVRHLRHVRMVVAEICLPLRMFRNGLELILIILYAISAHEQAYKSKHKLLHRDVSVGNILIRPRFESVEEGKSQIRGRGVLADWEMAKSEDVHVAMQPTRTGTWPFMSMLCQMDAMRPIEVADELESFFHVLVFMVVVYMASSWKPAVVDRFVPKYFYDGEKNEDGGETCSDTRDKCIRQGAVTTGHDPLKLYHVDDAGQEVPGHPLDDILSELLRLFRARLLVHEASLRASATSSAKATTSNTAPVAPGILMI